MNTLSICLIGFRPETAEYYVVTNKNKDKWELPSITLNKNITIEQALETLISKYVDLDVNWIPKHLIAVVKEGLHLNIIYSGQIPYDTPLKKRIIWSPITTDMPIALEATQYL